MFALETLARKRRYRVRAQRNKDCVLVIVRSRGNQHIILGLCCMIRTKFDRHGANGGKPSSTTRRLPGKRLSNE